MTPFAVVVSCGNTDQAFVCRGAPQLSPPLLLTLCQRFSYLRPREQIS